MKRTRYAFLSYGMVLMLTLSVACGGGGGSEGTGDAGGDIVAGLINLTGGDSSGGPGSQGGGPWSYSAIESDGDILLATAGTVDASFPDPVHVPVLGSNGYTVAADLTVQMDEDLVAGGLYVKSTIGSSSRHLYEGNGDSNLDNDPVVTGLVVQAGATLTLPSATDTDETPDAWYLFSDDIIVYGTVTTLDDSVYLSISSDYYTGADIVVESGGLITTVPDASGADGGRIYLYADGDLIVRGDILASGTEPGGGSDGVELDAVNDLHVMGTVRADGADNPSGDAGDAGYVYFYGYSGSIYIDGTITSDGGDSGNGSGGDGDYVYVMNGYVGDVPGDLLVNGYLSCSGGSAVGGSGGDAAPVNLINDTTGGVVKIDAVMVSRGGSATGPGSVGGNSNSVDIRNSSGGSLSISGSIDLSGGFGELNGGDTGYLWLRQNGGQGEDLQLLGFSGIDLTGGTGETGGAGGRIDILAAGTVTSGLSLITDGGEGTVTGGDAGDITIDSSTPSSNLTGTTSLSGGSGGTADGADGTLTVDGI